MSTPDIELPSGSDRLARSEARLALVVGAVNGALWHIDLTDLALICSPELVRLFTGTDVAAFGEAELVAAIEGDDLEYASFLDLMAGLCDRKTVEYHATTALGRRLLACDGLLLRAADGTPLEVVGLIRDITVERARESAARLDAETDPLTGLLNRRGLEQRLAGFPHAMPIGVLVIDLDRFKQVNDTQGHAAGDAMLVETARTIRGVMRELDIVVRLGGDEFLVVVPGADDATLLRLRVRLNDALSEKARVGITVGASIGAAVGQLSNSSFAEIVARADDELYREKSSAARRAA